MEFNANRVDEANAIIEATLTKEIIENNLDKVAKQAAKNMNIQGFRKGKVPVAVVKQRYADKLQEDAQSEAIRKILHDALQKLDIKNSDLIGDPSVTKFDKKEDGNIDIELSVSCKPKVDLGDYKALVPDVKPIEIEIEKIDERLIEIASSSAPLQKISRKRAVKKGDFALIDFEGFVNNVAFQGGKAEKFPLEIGSNSFIPGFEDQIIGMKYDEEKDIIVKFPENYQAQDLAGKEALFKVKLHEIQEKASPELNDEFAKKMLPDQKDATIDDLREKIKKQMESEKLSIYYRDELKPKLLDALLQNTKFALPTSLIEQEVNHILNNKIRSMNENEIKELQENSSKVTEMRDELRQEASDSVKATFIIDALAKVENVQVTDQEVSQVLYYEAMQIGQNPEQLLKQYKEAGYLPAIKMSMIEEKVVSKLLDEKKNK